MGASRLFIRSKTLALSMKADGTGVVFEDIAGKSRWVLDESTRFVANKIPRFDVESYRHGRKSAVLTVNSGEARKISGF